jgi:membrane protease YdiL (CAAX protease family)
MVGVIGGLPAAWGVMGKTAALANVPVQLLAAGQLLQSTIWMLLTVGIGLLLATKTGLGAPLLRGYLAGEQVGAKFRSRVLPSALLALFATVAVITLDRLFFLPGMPGFSSAIPQISGWQGILTSLYGRITGEILTRLFFVTLLAWILSLFSHTDDKKPSSVAMWVAIVSSAVIFGLGHIPATLASTSFSVTVLAREVLLNGIYGTLFGYLYWKRGLESSMMAHFTSDLLVHVILPAMF